jgi:hypothetical protein
LYQRNNKSEQNFDVGKFSKIRAGVYHQRVFYKKEEKKKNFTL